MQISMHGPPLDEYNSLNGGVGLLAEGYVDHSSATGGVVCHLEANQFQTVNNYSILST